MKTFDKYILREIIPPFVASFLIISFVLILGKMVDIINFILSGTSPFKILSLIFAVLMASLGFSLPPSFLVSCTIAFGRLSADAEIVALKSLGISARRAALSALITGFILSFFLLFINLFIAPLGNKVTKGIITDIILSRKNLGLEHQGFTEPIEGITVYVQNEEEEWFKDVVIFDMRQKEKFNVIEAAKGKIKRDASGNIVFYLKNGRIIIQGRKKLQFLNFKKYTISLTANVEELFRKPIKRELTFFELIKRLNQEKKEPKKKHYIETLVHFHKRFALAFSPFVFALIGIPISISFHRKERWASFIIALALFLLYFGILSFSQKLIYQGIPPFICAWLPNLSLLGIGSFLFFKKTEGERI